MSTNNIPLITDAVTILGSRYRPKIDWSSRLKNKLAYNHHLLHLLATRIGVSMATVQKFDIGYMIGDRKWRNLIPMYDKQGICGIQQRWYEGDKCHKRCQKYSKHGWFMPINLFKHISKIGKETKLFITEGFSDAAVIIELGYLAIGRYNALSKMPNCPIRLNQFKNIYITADNNECGIIGGKRLQKKIPNSKIIYPVIGNNTRVYKDIREMYKDIGANTRTWLERKIKS